MAISYTAVPQRIALPTLPGHTPGGLRRESERERERQKDRGIPRGGGVRHNVGSNSDRFVKRDGRGWGTRGWGVFRHVSPIMPTSTGAKGLVRYPTLTESRTYSFPCDVLMMRCLTPDWLVHSLLAETVYLCSPATERGKKIMIHGDPKVRYAVLPLTLLLVLNFVCVSNVAVSLFFLVRVR
jgi:hypothetical protein